MTEGYAGLEPCVHCGFCLPACPTYLLTGDENEGPRGRIVLMRLLAEGAGHTPDPDAERHLDNCLGCRGCEPVCPSGVSYGHALDAFRHDLFRRRGPSPIQRVALAALAEPRWWRPLFTVARWLRHTRLPALLAGSSRPGFVWGMLAATAGLPGRHRRRPVTVDPPGPTTAPGPTVAVFRGCIMDTLFPHVHDAVRRTLEANGFRIVDVPGQECCGALHHHAGDRDQARVLARKNVAAMPPDIDFLAVDSAGCGALLKDYGALLDDSAAVHFAGRVRDVSELLAESGPRRGAPLPWRVAYDAPCHLEHAQGVREAPLTMLRAIPDLELYQPPGYERCCGSAGLFSLDQPHTARTILDDKLATMLSPAATPAPDAVATGNPGCLMHIGAGLRAAGRDIPTLHPVELLDESYRRAGWYDTSP